MEVKPMRAVITVIGQDTVGILAKVSNICASYNANIIEVTQSVLQDLFCMIMLVDITGLNAEYTKLSSSLEALGKRPDLLMEASDITGELRMSMELIAIAEKERDDEDKCILDLGLNYRELMNAVSELNKTVLNRRKNELTPEDREFLNGPYITGSAVYIADKVLPVRGIVKAGDENT